MGSRRKSDLLSNLHDYLLVTIISFLPFKESVRTTVLSKRWKNLCRETNNLVFKESEFVNLSIFNDETRETIRLERVSFVRNICQWISGFTGKFIEKFELYLSEPMGFETDIIFLVEFAVSRDPKNVVLDFSIPGTRKIGIVDHLLTMLNYKKSCLDTTRLIFRLIYVSNLTICSFLLQSIQDSDDPTEVHDPLKTQHMVMKTNMHSNEFIGITIFLKSCPELESLTFDMVTTELIMRTSFPLDPKTYWLTNKTYECLDKTLKAVKVKNFRGGSNELHVLKYLIRTGRVMKRLDLHEAEGLNHDQMRLVLAGAEEVKQYANKASSRLQITLHNA